MSMNNDNEKPKKVKYGDKLWFRNEETGEWLPLAGIAESSITIDFAADLTEEGEAKLAQIVEPLGDLEIVPREA